MEKSTGVVATIGKGEPCILSVSYTHLDVYKRQTWASGIKSPIYCDNRLTLTAPEVRTMVENSLVQTIKDEYPECEVVMGTSTAGIAHAAIVGHLMGIPMGYVRSSAKDHGRCLLYTSRCV